MEIFGCVPVIAIGMTIEEAKALTRDVVAEELNGLPPQNMYCSNLAADALHKAIKDYESGQKKYTIDS